MSRRRQDTPKFTENLPAIDIDNDRYRLSSYNRRFILFDTNDEDRIIAHSSNVQLEILSKASRWHLDGTFKSAPTLFYQSYKVHGWYNEEMYNCGYILLKNKKKDIYKKAFSRLKSSAYEINYILDPKLVLLDFEKAAISAINEVYPNCQVIGCYFHFIQALWKNIQYKGLTNEYRTDSYLKKWAFKL